MQRLLVVVVAALPLCVVAQTQQSGKTAAKAAAPACRFDADRFQADLEQFIAQEAGLTPQEASLFFPVYADMLRRQRALRDKIGTLKRVKPTAAADCEANILEVDRLEMEIKHLQKTYHEKFMQLLPPSKVYDIIKAEDIFHRQSVKNMQAGKAKK